MGKRLHESSEKTTDFIAKELKGFKTSSLHHANPPDDFEVSVQLLQGAHRDRQVVNVLSPMRPPIPFSNIGRYRNCGSMHLTL